MSRRTPEPDQHDSGLDDLWADYRTTQDRRARERLILHYAPLVKYVAGRVAVRLPPTVDAADLVSNGMFGLIDAIEKYRPDRAVRFEPYAVSRIRGAIIDGLREMDWVPRAVRDRARDIEGGYGELQRQLGRMPTDEELAAHLGITVATLRRAFRQMTYTNVVALDELSSIRTVRGERGSLGDTVADDRDGDPVAVYEAEEMNASLGAAMAELPERERTVISLYYFEGMTLAEIGRVLDVTESRVSQLRTRAVMQLRGRLAAEH